MMLPCFLAFSQEAESPGNKPEMTVVARAEYSSVEEYHHLGNSSLYFLLDGNFTERLSYSASFHLLNADPKSLYENTLRSDNVNWLDWLLLSYDFGQFQFSLGKDYIRIGTWESDGYDFDTYYENASALWLNLPTYQWGGTLTWSPSDVFSLMAQVTTSPYGEKPFASGKYAFSLEALASFDWYNGIYSINHIDEFIFAMGHDFSFGKVDLMWDSLTELRSGYHGFNSLKVSYAPVEKWSFAVKAAYENAVLPDFLEEYDSNKFSGSLVVNWFPIEQLRVHALAEYNNILKAPSINLGVTWTMSL